jgi:hypothetical protein
MAMRLRLFALSLTLGGCCLFPGSNPQGPQSTEQRVAPPRPAQARNVAHPVYRFCLHEECPQPVPKIAERPRSVVVTAIEADGSRSLSDQESGKNRPASKGGKNAAAAAVTAKLEAERRAIQKAAGARTGTDASVGGRLVRPLGREPPRVQSDEVDRPVQPTQAPRVPDKPSA